MGVLAMPTNVTDLRIERVKAPHATSKSGATIAVLCMLCLAASLALLTYLLGTPDISDVAQFVGP
jgi:hypothetical protein